MTSRNETMRNATGRRQQKAVLSVQAAALAIALGWAGPAAAQDVVVPAPPDVAVDMTPHDGSFTVPMPDLPTLPIMNFAQDAQHATAPAPVVVEVPSPPDLTAIVASGLQDIALTAAVQAKLASPDLVWPRRLAKRERDAIVAFYETRGHAPAWIESGRFTERARQVLGTLARADENGLNGADYAPPRIDVLPALGAPAVLAEAEIRLSALAVLYARDARGGRIDPARLSKLWTPVLRLPAAPEVLETTLNAKDAGAALAAYQPPHAGYAALKSALSELRASRPAVPMVRVPPGRALKVGMRDARVPLVRARFGLGPTDEETIYDERVASAVAEFQKLNGLPASGILTDRTASLMSNVSVARREAQLIANMERWRWLPETLGERHIMVNVPEFRLRLVSGQKSVHEARVIVGKPETQTPIFSDEMDHAVVNPSWYIPPSIMKNDILPGLAANPNYAEERGYEVIRRGNSISVRQPPGERNALGFIKFMFPNEHAVYLHDTPNRRLFSAERRAFSHGCVRVDQPFRLADFVFEGDWDEKRLRAMIGKGERTLKLRKPLPVHLTYFTAAVQGGQVRTFDDLYGVDRKIAAALQIEN